MQSQEIINFESDIPDLDPRQDALAFRELKYREDKAEISLRQESIYTNNPEMAGEMEIRWGKREWLWEIYETIHRERPSQKEYSVESYARHLLGSPHKDGGRKEYGRGQGYFSEDAYFLRFKSIVRELLDDFWNENENHGTFADGSFQAEKDLLSEYERAGIDDPSKAPGEHDGP